MPIAKFKDVLYEETGGVATVTLHRPDRLNAIRVGMYEEISEAIRTPPGTRRPASSC